MRMQFEYFITQILVQLQTIALKQNLTLLPFQKQMTQPQKIIQKQLDFYIRAKKQYKQAAKPFTYELNIFSTQPKPKKLMIIINRFIQILKEGMKQEYSIEEELKENYWNQLEKYYGDTQYQMQYIIDNSYEKKKNKLKLYFGLLLHNKKIFDIITEVTEKLGFMYKNPQEKLKNLNQFFEPVDFLRDNQYNIMSEFVNQYEKYEEKQKSEEKLKQRIAQKEKTKQFYLQQAKKKKQEQQKQEKQLKQKIQRERFQKQKIQVQRKLKEQSRLKKNGVNDGEPEQSPLNDDSIAFIPQSYRTQNTHDKSVQPIRRRQQNRQAMDELPNWNQANKKTHKKHSQVLYEQKYKDEIQVFLFRLKPQLQSQQSKKQVCAECNKSLKQGFYFFGGNQNQCMYTGEWFCNEHMAQERISIPWKAFQSFDLRGYPVSRKSYIEIKSFYQKPIIQIKNQEEVVKHSRQLYEFLVLKRQIHLMYDSICDLELMQPLLKRRLNYCLKQNLFSLKNLYDIYNGHEGPSLQREYDILSKHFYRCPQCQKRKGYICSKCKDPVKIFAFELKETHGCTNCRKLYHRKCLPGGKCDCQQEQ